VTMEALTVRGTYNGPSGYDHHVREFVRALHRQGVCVRLVDIPHWHPLRLREEQRDPWFASRNQPVNSRLMLHFCMPPQVKIARGKLNVNFTMFEATRIPKPWVNYNRRHDLVIVPTESSYSAWVDSGYPPERIRLCPLGVDATLFRPGIEPWPIVDDQGRDVRDYSTRVLSVVNLTPRKNLLGLLRVWIESTCRADDAVLIVKLNCGSDEWLARFKRSIEEMEGQLGKSRKESAAVVFLVNRILSDREMPKVYAAATHYFSLSCGEGWDQPMMEAAATGLHLIAPSHSAYSAYLDDSIASLLPFRRVPAVFEWFDGSHTLFRGADWWEPDEAAAGACLRRVIATGKTALNLAARARVVEKYTWHRAAARLIHILDELESRHRHSGIIHDCVRWLWPRGGAA
jgi:glycosyltransferase involved in cell wall biosynthesis